MGEAGQPIRREFLESEEGWNLALEGMTAGVYRLEVRTAKAGPGAPLPVHEVFEIAG